MVQDDKEEEEEEEKCPSVAWLLRGLFACPLFAPSLKAGNFFLLSFSLNFLPISLLLCLTTGCVLILLSLLHFQVAYFAAVYVFSCDVTCYLLKIIHIFFFPFKCSDSDGGGRLMLLYFQGIRQRFLACVCCLMSR